MEEEEEPKADTQKRTDDWDGRNVWEQRQNGWLRIEIVL